MDIADIRRELQAAGARPRHEALALRAWARGLPLDAFAQRTESAFPARLKAALPGLAARLAGLATVVAEHPAADGAARAWEDAFAAAQVGRFLVRAGRAWEDALDFVRADTAYSRALRRDDLPYGVAAEAAARLVHARANRPPPPPDRTWAWVTGGAAAATLAFAGVAGLVSNDHHADVRDALARDLDGPVRAMTRAEALARQSQGDDWRTAAWVGLASGAALAVTSVVLYFAAPEPTSDIRLEAAATSDGLVLFARGSL